MDRIVVQGGERLAGEVAVSGSKNSSLVLRSGSQGDGFPSTDKAWVTPPIASRIAVKRRPASDDVKSGSESDFVAEAVA